MQTIREPILQATLNGLSILGILALIVVVPVRLKTGALAMVILYILAISWLMVITLVKRFPYNFRIFNLLAIDLLLGIVTLLNEGLMGNGRIFLLVFPFFAGIFLNNFAGFIALIFSWALVGITGYLNVKGIYFWNPFNELTSLDQDSSRWGVALAVFVLVSGSVFSLLQSLLHGVQHLVVNEKELIADLKAEREQLERRVHLRTQDLEKRLTQIRTAAEISNQFSAILDTRDLYQNVVDLTQDGFKLYFVGLYMVNGTGDMAELVAGTGEAGQQLMNNGYKVPISAASLVGWAILNQTARISSEADKNFDRFKNPLLPQNRSEIVIPLIKNRMVDQNSHSSNDNYIPSCVGAITVQSSQPMAFDNDDLLLFQSLANNLATAIENAELFSQVKTNLDEIRTLNRQYLRDAWSRVQSTHGILAFTAEDSSLVESSSDNKSLSMPFVLRDQVIGLLSLEKQVGDDEAFTLTKEEQVMVNAVVKETSLALENVRLLEEAQRRSENERLLSRLSQVTQRSNDVDSVLRMAVQELGRSLGASEALIQLDIPESQIAQNE